MVHHQLRGRKWRKRLDIHLQHPWYQQMCTRLHTHIQQSTLSHTEYADTFGYTRQSEALVQLKICRPKSSINVLHPEEESQGSWSETSDCLRQNKLLSFMKLIISAVSLVVMVAQGTFFFFKAEDSLDSLGLRILEIGNNQESYGERGSAWSQNCRNPQWPGRVRNV